MANSNSSYSVTVGKGSKKKELVIVTALDSYSNSDNNNYGTFVDFEHDVGATSDNPYGLRLLSIEVNAQLDYGVSETTASLITGVTKDGTNLGSYNTDDDLGMMAVPEMVSNVNSASYYYAVRNMAEDQGKIIVLPKIHISMSIANKPITIDINRKFVFEKIKLTKNEYLEKLVRNI